ncbi:MAG: SDR family oxidoreductase [Cyclobacterium sp.]|uniref:SDR family oxidoreductase n=1 Tax=unclassified Cyclobacterium TaxID=2615055 RepID=UPI0013D1C227|nr:SDR family oxidoreductase [Cyclobacterium sp. SYSU L10401]
MKYTEGMLVQDALKDQVVLVTGGGTGLGRSMTSYFLTLGAKLVISSRKMEVLEKTAAELREQTGAEVLPLECDIRDYEQVDRMFRQAREYFGKIDVVVNNAAANFISPTDRLSVRAFHTILDIVLKGTANLTLIAGKDWISRKNAGVFLNIVTTYAFTGSAYVVPSAAAKAGVLAMTRSLAVEWAPHGIRSNAIAPGPFPTAGAWDRLLPGELADKFNPAKRVPLGRVGDHQELANLAAYLISPYSAYINGEIITIDGGEWLQGAGQFNGLKSLNKEFWDSMEKQRKGSG